MFYHSPVKNSIIIYLLIAIIILVKKPDNLFDGDGEMIEFGTKPNQSLFNYPVLLYILAIVVTFFFEYIGLKKY